MPKFNPGDIITGKNKTDYGITTSDAIMEVLECNEEGRMRVKLIEHKTNGANPGDLFTVSAEHFIKIEKKVEEKKIMNNNSVYWECKDNGHSKFWAANIIKRGNVYVLVRKWGAIGNNPQTMEQEFSILSGAEQVLNDLIKEKEGKGYKAIF